MRDRTVDRVESWDARPFSGGFASLRELADGGFSGVVVSGDAWLFMLNGRVVGIVDGDIDDFEDASGTMYEAPDPALPLLFSMQERGGTTQAKYYTNDTPLPEADRTLSDANFTGYVELSENVLSGDYYLVYYGGRMLPVAFVGTTEELKSGDEAYDLASDEVGVYEVIKTPVNVTQVPEPAGAAFGEAAEAASGTAAAGAGTASADHAETAASNESAENAEGTGQSSAESHPVEAAEPESTAADDDATPASTPPTDASADSPESTTEDVVEAAESPTDAEPSTAAEQSEAGAADSTTPVEAAGPTQGAEAGEASADGAAAEPAAEPAADEGGPDSSVFSEEEQWRQTKSIPSLSPSEREKRRRKQAEQASGGTSTHARQGSSSSARSKETSGTQSEPVESSKSAETGTAPASKPERSAQPAAQRTQEAEASSTSGDVPESEVRKYRARIEELEGRLEQLDDEKTDVESELESVRDERDELQRRVRQLETALEEAGGEPASGPSLTPDEALAGTNLFVRYGSKGQPTLDELTGKNPDKEAINTNLRIDHHTQFESGDASVDGMPFSQFLESSSSYRFVSWLVRELPYEILDAGRRSGLADFYKAVPDIDRAELQGVVDVESESGTERREFDIVLRDRMGNPLVVADLNDERDPVTGDEMESLVDAATVVGEGADDLGAAFYVTASFFEPDALENAGDATANGGILSRSDRMSYVKLGRKRGFHLCLTEDRNETFHLTVPEL